MHRDLTRLRQRLVGARISSLRLGLHRILNTTTSASLLSSHPAHQHSYPSAYRFVSCPHSSDHCTHILFTLAASSALTARSHSLKMDASLRTSTKPEAVESTTPPYSPLTSSRPPSVELTTSSKDDHEKARAPKKPDGMKFPTLTTTYTPQGASDEKATYVEIEHKDFDTSSASKPPTPLSSSKRGQMRAASTVAIRKFPESSRIHYRTPSQYLA